MRIPRRRPRPPSADTIRATWQCVSLLLDYPAADVGPVPQVVAGLPARVRAPLQEFLDFRGSHELEQLQQEYVDTFDTRRKGNLFLTYFVHGDTRKRGMALLRFKQTYLDSGMELDDGELPDHLCVVLEFAATADLDAGRRLLLDHRAGFEVLRTHLHEQESAWAHLLDAVEATLPALQGAEQDAVRRLVQEGPPAEEVGLTPYGTPAFDAKLMERAAVDLPMPTVPGKGA